jgi:hypothetical protein
LQTDQTEHGHLSIFQAKNGQFPNWRLEMVIFSDIFPSSPTQSFHSQK